MSLTTKIEFIMEPSFKKAFGLFKKVWLEKYQRSQKIYIESNAPGTNFYVEDIKIKVVSIPIRNSKNGQRDMSLDAVQEFFFGRKWPKYTREMNIDSDYEDLKFCGGFAKYLKKLIRENPIQGESC